uniref:C2 domain-containing protein n=1 Tax=Cannabis sativa TaxID=3483 RepID=A0A803QFK8_CANSA
MASSRPPPAKPLDLELTIVSAKHLKNVNWKNGGDLKPYAVFWVDPDRRLATKSDDSGSTQPVWNERFTLPLTASLHDSFLTLEIFHSKPSETPKPLVGTLRVPIKDLPDPNDSTQIRTFVLTRPSGRPQGYYSSAPPPPMPPRPFFDRPMSYGGPSGPSAPVDYSPYDQKPKTGKMGLGTGLAVGAVAGALGGIALEEGLKYEEDKIADRVETDLAARDDYSDYREHY